MDIAINETYKIENTSNDNLEFVYWLFDEAIAYQKKKNYTVWNGYDKEVLQKDIDNKLQFKVTKGMDILCIFSICFSDPIIWREKENGDAIYLHRIVVNPNFKGQKQFEKILNWTKVLAKKKRLEIYTNGHLGRQSHNYRLLHGFWV